MIRRKEVAFFGDRKAIEMRHELHYFSRHDFAHFSKRVVKTLIKRRIC